MDINLSLFLSNYLLFICLVTVVTIQAVCSYKMMGTIKQNKSVSFFISVCEVDFFPPHPLCFFLAPVVIGEELTMKKQRQVDLVCYIWEGQLGTYARG